MRRTTLLCLIAATTTMACGITGETGQTTDDDAFTAAQGLALNEHAPRYIVHAAEGHGFTDVADAVHRHGGSVTNLGGNHGFGLASMPDQHSADALGDDDAIDFIERDRVWTLPGNETAQKPDRCPPTCGGGGGGGGGGGAPAQTTPWGIAKVNAPLAWTGATGNGIVVAVVDTGILQSHADLNVTACANFTKAKKGADSVACEDGNGHGTHVAGTIGAMDNDAYVVGVAPDVEFYAVKVLSDSGSGWTSDIINGVYWAADNGANVINMSLGGTGESQAFDTACADATAAGVFIAVAAGNNGDDDPTTADPTEYPAGYGSTEAVAATDENDVVTYFSNSNPDVDLSAPGLNIESTYNDGGLATMSGTSMASPHVAGSAALLMSAGATNAAAKAALESSAKDLGVAGYDIAYGNGRVDVAAALCEINAALPPCAVLCATDVTYDFCP